MCLTLKSDSQFSLYFWKKYNAGRIIGIFKKIGSLVVLMFIILHITFLGKRAI